MLWFLSKESIKPAVIFDNILRFFDVLPNFPFTTNETMRNYYL